jgi:hypothetical protein
VYELIHLNYRVRVQNNNVALFLQMANVLHYVIKKEKRSSVVQISIIYCFTVWDVIAMTSHL